MVDPLSLVREATIRKVNVKHTNGIYYFGAHQFAELTPTSFRRTLKSNEYFYTLKDIFFFLENIDLSVADYRRKAVEARITAVVEQDRQALRDYLNGLIESCPQIDIYAAADFSQAGNAVAGGDSRRISSASNTAATGSSGSAVEATIPQISSGQLQEQRLRHAEIIESAVRNARRGSDGEHATQRKGSLKRKVGAILSSSSSSKPEQASTSGALVGAAGGADELLVDKDFMLADKALLGQLRVGEVPTHTRNSVLEARHQDFGFALKLFNDRILKHQQQPQSTAVTAGHSGSKTAAAVARGKSGAVHADRKGSSSSGSSSSSNANNLNRSSQQASGDRRVNPQRSPIIVVPNSLTSIITLLNVEDFLIKGTYISTEDKRKAGVRKEREKYISRPAAAVAAGGGVGSSGSGGGSSASTRYFKVVDDAERLSAEDWERVVAVFAAGQEWQFKGWKAGMDQPVQLFQNVLGVHVTVEGSAVSPTISSWNCKVLKVNLFKQHINASLATHFWAQLDDFIRVKKPHYLLPTARPAGPPPGSQQSQQQQQQASHQRSVPSGAGTGASSGEQHSSSSSAGASSRQVAALAAR